MSFLSSLSHEQLIALRQVVKRVHINFYPDDLCTDREADRVIEALGPEVLEKQLKAMIDSGMFVK
jgi:hypothetical protein